MLLVNIPHRPMALKNFTAAYPGCVVTIGCPDIQRHYLSIHPSIYLSSYIYLAGYLPL